MHNPILLSISGHCFVFAGRITGKYCCLFPDIFIFCPWKTLLKGRKTNGRMKFPKNIKRQHNNMTCMMSTMPMPLLENIFSHAVFKIKSEGKIISIHEKFLLAKDAWGRIFWITFRHSRIFALFCTCYNNIKFEENLYHGFSNQLFTKFSFQFIKFLVFLQRIFKLFTANFPLIYRSSFFIHKTTIFSEFHFMEINFSRNFHSQW